MNWQKLLLIIKDILSWKEWRVCFPRRGKSRNDDGITFLYKPGQGGRAGRAGRWCLIQLGAKYLNYSGKLESVLAIKCHKSQVRCKAETEKAFKSSRDKFTLIKINGENWYQFSEIKQLFLISFPSFWLSATYIDSHSSFLLTGFGSMGYNNIFIVVS